MHRQADTKGLKRKRRSVEEERTTSWIRSNLSESRPPLALRIAISEPSGPLKEMMSWEGRYEW
jgi:hypothetical protein